MSKKPLAIALAGLGIAAAAPALAASPSAQGAPTRAKLQVRTGAIGKYVADRSGRSLYMFANDRSRRSVCSGTCAKAWPPYLTSGAATAGSGISKGKLGTIKRKDGSSQVTYNGHPLYRFAADTAAGQTRGQGVKSVWYLLTPAGSKLVKEPTTTTPTTPTAPTAPGY